jgi:hypothetical protein
VNDYGIIELLNLDAHIGHLWPRGNLPEEVKELGGRRRGCQVGGDTPHDLITQEELVKR